MVKIEKVNDSLFIATFEMKIRLWWLDKPKGNTKISEDKAFSILFMSKVCKQFFDYMQFS